MSFFSTNSDILKVFSITSVFEAKIAGRTFGVFTALR
jgi:hypothetical protein